MEYFEIDANIIDATLVKNINYNELLNNNLLHQIIILKKIKAEKHVI